MTTSKATNNGRRSRPVARAALILSACLFSTQAAAFASAPYFPLPDGATWTYNVSDGTTSSTETRTVAGTRSFNGAQVKIIRDQAGNENYFTNDDAGVRVHGALFVDPVNGNETDTYSPPVPFAARDSIIGTQVPGSGSATGVQGSDTITFNYTSGSTPLAIETVTVPAGTFTNAVHVRLTIRYSGVVNFSATLDDWLVAGVGSVREVSTDTTSSTTTTWELRSYAIRRPLADFSGDGHSDVLWRNTSTGENYIWLMNGLSTASQGSVNFVDPASGWQVQGVGDFDGDGKADILWRNTSTGENYIYLMNGLTIARPGSINSLSDQAWQVQGIGDFDGDGKADIVWRNSTSGENYLYPMDGTTIKPTMGSFRTVADLAWQIVAVGDYDGDGKADVLWRHATSGENYLYPMDGTAIKASEGYLRSVPQPNWQIQNPPLPPPTPTGTVVTLTPVADIWSGTGVTAEVRQWFANPATNVGWPASMRGVLIQQPDQARRVAARAGAEKDGF